jgi:hypothetical protein
MRWAGLTSASDAVRRAAAWLAEQGRGSRDRFKAWFSGLHQDERETVLGGAMGGGLLLVGLLAILQLLGVIGDPASVNPGLPLWLVWIIVLSFPTGGLACLGIALERAFRDRRPQVAALARAVAMVNAVLVVLTFCGGLGMLLALTLVDLNEPVGELSVFGIPITLPRAAALAVDRIFIGFFAVVLLGIALLTILLLLLGAVRRIFGLRPGVRSDRTGVNGTGKP